MGIDSMLDLNITPLQNGGFELSQLAGGLEEPDLILLHPCQIRYLCEQAGLLTPDPTPRLSARHVGRLHALRDRLHDLHDLYYNEIVDRCGSGIEISLHLEAIADLVYEMIEDIGTAPPSEQCNADVTLPPLQAAPKATKRAMTGAERVAKHRAKQGELLPADLGVR